MNKYDIKTKAKAIRALELGHRIYEEGFDPYRADRDVACAALQCHPEDVDTVLESMPELKWDGAFFSEVFLHHLNRSIREAETDFDEPIALYPYLPAAITESKAMALAAASAHFNEFHDWVDLSIAETPEVDQAFAALPWDLEASVDWHTHTAVFLAHPQLVMDLIHRDHTLYRELPIEVKALREVSLTYVVENHGFDGCKGKYRDDAAFVCEVLQALPHIADQLIESASYRIRQGLEQGQTLTALSR